MSTDIFSRVYFNDGEGVDPVDFNGISDRILAIMYDQFVSEMFPREGIPTALGNTGDLDADRSNTISDNTRCPYAIAVATSGARPRQGSGNNKVQLSPGTLLQAVAEADGTEPKLLAFKFAGTEEVTIANGDATNPRVDIVQMALSYAIDTTISRDFKDAVTGAVTTTTPTKRRRVQCTLSVKQGTPAASPTYPTPDAGCVVIAGVVVGATYAGGSGLLFEDTAGAVVVLHDQRLPLRVRPHGVWPSDYIYPDGGDYVYHGHIYVSRDVHTSPLDIFMPCTRWGNTGRLVAMDCAFSEPSTLTSKLCRWLMSTGGVINLNNANMNGSGAGSLSLRQSGRHLWGHAPDVGPTVLAASNGMGAPIWTNGMRAPGLQPTGETDTTFPVEAGNLVLRYVDPPVATRFHRVTFYIAEGL